MPISSNRLEVWGGIECTINRVGDRYNDQLEYAGHYRRSLSDIDAIAATGISALRYPVLWERHCPTPDATPDFSFAETGLKRLMHHGIRPIVGLVHHGSGPVHVSFLDDSFAHGLARYATEVARRFPWVEDYTPVNEPLTTARFCGAYGHWYPHGHDEGTFFRILLAECKATVLAMEAIRKENPRARLIHTEDLGKTYSTPRLAYQARYENGRRWLGLDLLCGRVDKRHRFFRRMLSAGIPERSITWFLQHPCPPDVLGFNYYVTSERFLDEACERYPNHVCGGNGRHRYADVELVRVPYLGPHGPKVLLREAAERYGLPIALTEVHLHCARDEQMRWWHCLWNAAKELKQEGVDIRAVTSWAVLGSVGWNDLLRRPGGAYESGAFCIAGGAPRPTALVCMLQTCAAGESFHHPVLDVPGWWARPARVLYNRHKAVSTMNTIPPLFSQPLLILGKTGTLGSAFARVCTARGLHHHLLSRAEMNLESPEQIADVLRTMKPWAVVNAAGYVRVDDAETDAAACNAANAEGPAHLARACAAAGIPLITFSSDLVFDGTKGHPYTEADVPAPLNVYGHTKRAAELAVLREHPGAIVVRTSAFFGPWDEYNFVRYVLRQLEAGLPVDALSDAVVSPTYVPHLVDACLDLLLDHGTGLYHLCNDGATSWYDWACEIARRAGYSEDEVIPRTRAEMGLPAARPGYCAMTTERGVQLPRFETAMEEYFHAAPRPLRIEREVVHEAQ